MKKNAIFLALGLATASFQGSSTRAAEVSTDPMGVVSFEASGNSDSYVYLPVRRVPEFVGKVATLTANGTHDLGEPYTDSNSSGAWNSGEAFTDTNNVVTLSGTPNLTSDQFVYAGSAQPKRYYLLVTSGVRAGMYYSVLSNTTGAVTIDTAGDSLSGALVADTAVQVVPYNTLGTIFPGGAGVHSSATHSVAVRQSEIILPDNTSIGKDLAGLISYYYFSGTSGAGQGWRKAGAASVLADDDILPPDSFFIIRHNVAASTTVKIVGGVQMGVLSTPLNTSSGVDQDNSVALPFATEMTLAQLKLIDNGVFAGSSSHSVASRQDQVLVWDNTVPGKNKAADLSYYYYTGANAPGPGWRKAGFANTLADSDVVISRTKSIVIRKKAGSSPLTSLWSVRPPYSPAP